MSCLNSLEEVIKGPTEVLNVSMDFTDPLDGATISSQDVDITPSGITVSNVISSGGIVYFTVAGVTLGYTYSVEVTITTSGSETLVGSGKLKIRE